MLCKRRNLLLMPLSTYFSNRRGQEQSSPNSRLQEGKKAHLNLPIARHMAGMRLTIDQFCFDRSSHLERNATVCVTIRPGSWGEKFMDAEMHISLCQTGEQLMDRPAQRIRFNMKKREHILQYETYKFNRDLRTKRTALPANHSANQIVICSDSQTMGRGIDQMQRQIAPCARHPLKQRNFCFSTESRAGWDEVSFPAHNFYTLPKQRRHT